MHILLACLIVLNLTELQAQDPRKRYDRYEEVAGGMDEEEDISCATGSCLKRSSQDEMGPFWANRGKKSFYNQDHLYAEEPHWILLKDEKQPFFVTRGKKDKGMWEIRYQRNFGIDSPFYAARGKKQPTGN